MNPSVPKVLHIVCNLIRGGTEGQCARLAMQLPNQRVAVFRREGFFLKEVEHRCGEVYHIDIKRLVQWNTLAEIWRLRSFIRREGFDLVHAWDADAAIFGSLSAWLAGVPFLTSRRDLGQIYPRWKVFCMHIADRFARGVVVNAMAIKRWRVAAGIPEGRIHVIANILDLKEFDRLAAADFPLPCRGRWIAIVNRLDPEKDVDVVIEAARLLKPERPEVRFAIAGDGVERARLERLAAEKGVADTVHFLGDITAVPSLLQKCFAGILTPKTNEGLSNTIMEYMAAGLPVVATDCGGNAELVLGGNCGVVVPIGDARQVAETLASWLGDQESSRQLGANGRLRIETLHQPAEIAALFAQLYRRALQAVGSI